MITFDEILNAARSSRRRDTLSDHRHDLEDREFNIQGHRVRGKVCKICGERFFRADDLLPIEDQLQAAAAGRAPIDLEDAVILLAGAYPDIEVPGKLVMQKEMFLFEKSFAPRFGLSIESARYVPHHMGPFSRKLERLLADMKRRDLIEARPLPSREGVSFKLTERGRALAEDKRRLLPDEVWRELRRKRRAWDELGSQGLLRLVYQEFSAYAGESKIRRQVEEGSRHED